MAIFGKDKEQDEQAKTEAQAPASAPQKPGVMSSAALLKKEATIPQKVIEDSLPKTTNDAKFSDLYITPDKTCYVWSGKSNSGLKVAKFIDLQEFINAVIEKYDGHSASYSLHFKGRDYRIERTIALEGEQYCARKMPTSIPDLEKLGLPSGIYRQLLTLADKSGLILIAGATGTGKSTTISALLKKYLQTEGGYAFTIEDPIEMPLDGIYQTTHGDLGLCKQTTPPDGKWEEGIKSALRSKPRYIYLGEIRSPEAAEELLRAATSGHLVFSTIHANNVADAVNALAKYAASSGISEEMSYELMANGLLACIHQNLVGTPKRLRAEGLFANPNINGGCPVRTMLRSGKLSIATLLEQQKTKLERGLPLFENPPA
ncbi:MAG: Flp pilus assembly complex ATPase component TadA [Alphaproteobacteria bacterium]|nr:Flp pilus assembly complex ATPase component TadA [Alphaproteobacteria bacterium]